MNWIDEGFLIHKNRYSENSIISEFYTKERGKVSGIIFGGTSKKIKNYLQIGNKLHIRRNHRGNYELESRYAHTHPNYTINVEGTDDYKDSQTNAWMDQHARDSGVQNTGY